jgi:F420H(2)-dependent quinone reductase
MKLPNIRPGNSLGHRVVTRIASTTLGITVIRKVGPRIDPTLIRFTGGRLSSVTPFPALLLSHTGARTGVTRTTPIVYFTDAGRVIVIVSNFGARTNPAWYHNIKANPEVTLLGRGFRGVLPRRGTGWSRTRPTVPPRGRCIAAIRPLPAVGDSPIDRRDRLPPDRVTACSACTGSAFVHNMKSVSAVSRRPRPRLSARGWSHA